MLRITVLVAVILLVSTLAVVGLLYRSTSRAFVEVQHEELIGSPASAAVEELMASLEHAHARGGRAALWVVADRKAGLPPFVLLDDDGALLATSEPALATARGRRTAAGEWELAASGSEAEVSLNVLGARTLSLAPGESAHLILLPAPVDLEDGRRFARDAWQAAALGISLAIALAMAAVAWLLRRSLSPIDRLTRAAGSLRDGRRPDPLPKHGGAEFDDLIEAFNAAAASIERTEQLRRSLIADVGHELRTPVTNIRAQLEALQTGLIEADEEFLGTIAHEARQLERLAEDFQQLAVADAGHLRIEPRSFDLHELASSLMEPLVAGTGTRLRVEIPARTMVLVDDERLRQVFANLTENALRHQPRGLQLTLSAAAGDGVVILRFADNGPGVPPEHQAYIFERFYRVEGSRNRSTGGSGLGLTIAERLLSAMGGGIRYLDDDRFGAVFELRLPAAEQ